LRKVSQTSPKILQNEENRKKGTFTLFFFFAVQFGTSVVVQDNHVLLFLPQPFLQLHHRHIFHLPLFLLFHRRWWWVFQNRVLLFE
jgi:hypothetical protein